MSNVKRVDRVGPIISFRSPERATRDIRRAAGVCEDCGGELTVDGTCAKRVERRDKDKQ